MGCGKICGHTFLSDVKIRLWFIISYRKKNQCTNCMKVIHYIFLIREALDLPGIITMKKFVKSRP